MRALFLALILLASPLGAATYYVDDDGDDGDDGLTPETAWATLQRAADAVAAGDTVVALEGRYRGFNLFTSGTFGAPITFTGHPGLPAPNPAVVIDRPNDFTGVDGINLEGASWIVVEGFTLLGDGAEPISRAGIRIVGFEDEPAGHVVVRHNRVDRPGRWGVFTGFADDLEIRANAISGAADEHGIYVSNSGDRPVIRDNEIWECHANGIHMNGDASLGGDGVISGALVEGNRIRSVGVGGGSGINADGVVDSVFRNNEIRDAHASGISLYRIDGGAPSTGNLVANNTVVVAADGRWALNVQDGSSSNTLVNNVLLSEHPDRGTIDLCGSCLAGTVSDHNAVEDRFSLDEEWIDLATWRARTGLDPASFVASADELFLDPAAGDLRPARGSPALEAGRLDGAPSEDLRRIPRPQGPGVDVGCYEAAAGLLLVSPVEPVAGLPQTWAVHGAAPGAQVVFAGAPAAGVTPLPGCPGVELGLARPRALATGIADAAGTMEAAVDLPPGAGGRTIWAEGAERPACAVTGAGALTVGGAAR